MKIRSRGMGGRVLQRNAEGPRSQRRAAHLRERGARQWPEGPRRAPFGTWQDRFIDWFRDLGFLGKPGVETKAAQEIAAHLAAPTSTK
jgi:hypothetical protein